MGPLSRLSLDVVLAAIVAIWFIGTGIAKLPAPPAGRRAAVSEPTWARVLRRVRGVAEILGGLAVAGGAAIILLRPQTSFPGMILGLGLAALAAWTVAEAVTQRRWVKLAAALIGFVLAVAYAGFRG